MLSAIKNVGNPTLGDAIEFCWSSVLLNLSRMTTDRDRLGFLKGTYYIPQNSRCTNVLGTVANKFRMMLSGLKAIHETDTNAINISTDDARFLQMPSNSADYIFTDPPYADKEQYGELNFVWEAWLGFDTHWHEDEIIINEVRGKTEDDWANMMRAAVKECYRVLKPGRWLSLCYHDTSEGTWALVQDIMAESGFIVGQSDAALFIDTGQKSYNQKVADKVNKRDLVINFRKPKPGEVMPVVAITGDEDERTFNEKVRQIIRDSVGTNPGCTKDRIYDEVVSRMVRAGQMEAHDFDELLRQVAEEVKTPVMKNLFEEKDPDLFGTHEIGRWYLKETGLVAADEAETAKEDSAAKILAEFIIRKLKEKYPSLAPFPFSLSPSDFPLCPDAPEGVHYSDLFEHYIYAVKDKPRRQLAEFLPDYFYKTEQGAWRLPASEEESQFKAQGREKGLSRKIRRYVAYLQSDVPLSPFPFSPSSVDLAEWIRHCKRAGLYEHGKLLYEKGGINPDTLPQEAMAGVEEDYQVCARMLARNEGKWKTRKGKGAREDL